jgi:FKBP-type peptidyl-prolyl cis-trans isomerase SlyD
MVAHIDQVGETTVRLDFNHPLAGKELHFAVKIAGLRPATEEELEH